MRFGPRIHDLYVGRVVISTVALTWAVLVGLDVVMAFSSEMGDLGKGSYNFGDAISNTLYSIPRRMYTLFPTAAVIGSLMGMGQLAGTSELTALRAVGLSRRRLSLSVAAALALMTLVMVVNGETLAPWAQRQADQLKVVAKNNNMAVAQYSGLWAREGNTFLNAVVGEEKDAPATATYPAGRMLELRDVRLYEIADDGRLASITQAATVENRGKEWLLKNGRRLVFTENSVTAEPFTEKPWTSRLDGAAMASSLTRPRYLSARELGKSIDYRKRNHLDAREYEDVYWSRWFYPVNVLALCLAAIPFAFGTLRSGGLGKRLFLGIIFALAFWLLQLQFSRLAGAFHFDYRLAYTLPPIVMLTVSAWLFKRKSG